MSSTLTFQGATIPPAVFTDGGSSVAYGNGLWVAVGQNSGGGGNNIITSIDGQTWSTVSGTQFTGGIGNGVAYENGLWVAVGSGTNTILTSTNGTSWSAVTGTTFTTDGSAIAYGNGLWVAVGSGTNTILTSTDGTSWSAVSGTTFSSQGSGVAYGNGLWVAVGEGTNTILTSTNGTSWTAVSGATFTSGYGVAYGNGLWVAVGSGTNKLLTSTDGTSWSGAVSGATFTIFGGGVGYGNGRWVAVGSGTNKILTSTDGTNWSVTSGITTPSRPLDVGYGNGLWVVVGGGTSGTNSVLFATAPPSDAPGPPPPPPPPAAVAKTPCFLEGSKIFTSNGYVPIEHIRRGHMVKTVKNGFVPVEAIGVREINHLCTSERIGDQLYVCSANNYPELTEDLVITGHHSVLVKNFSSQEQREATEKALGNIYVTDEHYRLPACADSRTTVYPIQGNFKVYHLALKNNDYYMNYGIYANGLLVETTSRRYLLEKSGMTLLE